jgi:hypothetical protein
MSMYAKLVGDFDWKALCMPSVPWSSETRKMQFFPRNDETPILVAMIMGLQHAFAMIGGTNDARGPEEPPPIPSAPAPPRDTSRARAANALSSRPLGENPRNVAIRSAASQTISAGMHPTSAPRASFVSIVKIAT